MNVEVKIKRVHADAILPMQANPGDAGMDLYSIEAVEIPAGVAKLIKTGIQIELPKGTEAQIRPRSGLALKHSVTVLNSQAQLMKATEGNRRYFNQPRPRTVYRRKIYAYRPNGHSICSIHSISRSR